MNTRERILEAAAQLFSDQGFDGTSTRVVGAAADANIGTIAYHFGGKEGLYNAALARMYERVLEVQLPADLGDRPEVRIRTVMATVWSFCLRERPAVRLLLRHVLERGSLPAVVRDQWATKTLTRALEIQTALGISDLADRRLALLSLNHLLARYTVSSAADLTPYVDGDWEDAVARHLGDVAVALLL